MRIESRDILTQRKTLANTNYHTPGDKASDVALRRECLHEGGNDNAKRTRSHSDATTEAIGNGTGHEEACHDGTNGVGSIDSTNGFGVLLR